MNKKPGHVFVWPIGTRIIHWMMAFSFITAFITSFYEHLLRDHVALGFIFLTIIIYRIIWGVIGPKYATFDTFKLSLPQLKHYFVKKIQNRWRKIPAGHNPASSWFAVWALTVGTVIVISGLLLYGVQEGKGIFMDFNSEYSHYMGLLGMVHKYASYLFLAWVLIHIAGVMVEQFWHKTGMAFAMITGYKKTEGEDTTVKVILSFFAYSMIVIAIGSYFFIISSNDNFLTQRKYTNIDYAVEHPVFHKECGDCHDVYPPFLLPEKSWKRIMDDLDNHFGEKITDANISLSYQASIRDYLYSHSAEHSTREVAVKMMDSLGERRPKAITKTPYWRETHKDIPRSAYKDKKIKDKSNCIACHNDFEFGNMDDMNIIYRQ